MNYEMVMGLEVHVELGTKSKIFCSCTTEFGGEPNTHCCPICMGIPGTLPVLNEEVLNFALLAGLALNCEITLYNKFDRKNYFYPDLPKAYQISQLYLPFARNGSVEIEVEGRRKLIGIHEIHMEEDAGKLIHSPETNETFTDYNRCGVPLIEIVSEPDFRSADEVIAYLEKLKSIFEYLGISDCKMQEGSLRVDVNLSVREKGNSALGIRTEMKNLNSFKAIERAIMFEAERQISVVSSGGKILQETRRWDDNAGKSFSMRSKENAQDYRYFPEPDIPPILIGQDMLDHLRGSMPEFAEQKSLRYIEEFGLSPADAKIIASSKYFADLFERTVFLCNDPKEVRFWMINQIFYLLKDRGLEPEDISLLPEKFSQFVQVIKADLINRQTGKIVFEEMLFGKDDFDIEKYIRDNGLLQVDDTEAIRQAVLSVISANPKTVEQYKSGQIKVVGFFVGQVMKAMQGKAKPETVNCILAEELSKL